MSCDYVDGQCIDVNFAKGYALRAPSSIYRVSVFGSVLTAWCFSHGYRMTVYFTQV